MFPSRAHRIPALRTGAAGALLLLLLAIHPASLPAQYSDSYSSSGSRGGAAVRDEPTAHQYPTEQPKAPEHGSVRRFLEAVCWYIPNRIVDLTDIPRLYFTFSDGMGASVRATSYANATWFHDNAYCLGWSMRQPPIFSEQINERYFGLLAARQGELDRDPSEVGFSFHFMIVGLNAAASLSEAADFALGFIGIDLRADDHGPVLGLDKSEPEQPEPELQPATEAKTETTIQTGAATQSTADDKTVDKAEVPTQSVPTAPTTGR